MLGIGQLVLAIRYYFLSQARKKGHQKYGGRPKDVCEHIIDDCWTGVYYKSSIGNSNFDARDFGMSVKSLLSMYHQKEVISTLEYVLHRYSENNKITLKISPSGSCFTPFNNKSIDAVAWILRALRIAEAGDLVKEHKQFLKKEVHRITKSVYSRDMKLIRPDAKIDKIRRNIITHSSCYDNCLFAMMAEDADFFNILPDELKRVDFKKAILETFWNGKYFKKDITDSRAFLSEANLAPFITGLISGEGILRKVMNGIKARELNLPSPVKPVSEVVLERQTQGWINFFTPDTSASIQSRLGLEYIKLLHKVDKYEAKEEMQKIIKLLTKDGTLFEFYNPDNTPEKTWSWMSDEGMLYLANLASLL